MDVAIPAAPVARAGRSGSKDRKAGCESRHERLPPWCRSASTATTCRRPPTGSPLIASPVIAKIEAAGSYPSLPIRADTNPQVQNPFRLAQKSNRCDLLHIMPSRLALNHKNGPENLPITAGCTGRHRNRPSLDRDRDRRRAGRADLSHSDLIKRRDRGSLPQPSLR
jgi:hypothetical protein